MEENLSKIRYVIYFIITILIYVSLYFLFQTVTGTELAISPTVAISGILVYALSLTLRGLRFQILVNLGTNNGETGKHRKRIAIGGVYLAWGLNAFLPARLGEVTRLFVAEKYDGISKTRTFDSIILEKILDLSSMALIGILAFVIVITNNQIPQSFLIYIYFMLGMVFLGIFLMGLFYKLDMLYPLIRSIPKIGNKMMNLAKKLRKQVKQFVDNKQVMGVSIILSLGIWILDSLVFYIILTSITYVPPAIGILSVMIGFIAFIFPILPNAAGQFEAIVGFVFEVFDYSFNLGFEAALFDHIVKAVTGLSLGIVTLLFFGIKPIYDNFNSVEIEELE